ncbi:1-deoxy-D-xylulose 5-phosphate synthase [Acetivibrio straminisolvens JCM 21531]|uniref:1-deoxy-D-xylulose-5-phosphate synthase n=1 Tax=Acetivibrio straminisolvens JCM 21531 TaxID=1294263 RepID=W4V4A6_9FIRM|nr:1-deoxy-D-xylulose 5-phosphate synthase [Acetivibrio straminisolvens JCM 21531]
MEYILDNINSPDDIKKLNLEQLRGLASEIRSFLIEKVSKTGGHLASNLGVVELTLALHRVFNTPEDRIIWDVGHQSYVHKIITGRKDKFDTIRKLGGLSGFPKSAESEHDAFNTGHSSTSISAALGIAKARDLKKEKYSVIAVIGDGALTGGMAFEALNDAGRSPNNLIVILNDNEMSISKNVGGLSAYLSKIRTEPFYFKVKEDIDIILNKIPAIGKSAVKALDRVKGTIKYMIMPGIVFEELGFKYLGPIDGHNIAELENVLTRAKNTKGPVLVHVCTQKGRGYTYAEENPAVFHGISPFEIETGEVIAHKVPGYSDVFGREIVRIAEKEERVVALTAAMPHGTGLDKFSKRFPERFFDVGIAEQHAVTFGAGLAKNGMIPVIALYSSFLQRAYDQVVHDVALQNLHVVFAIDRAGIVGEDGETHQGIYDISFLRHIPNMAILAPCDYSELTKMLEYAVLEHDGPIAIRYPRGAGAEKLFDTPDVKLGQSLLLREGRDVTIAAVGNKVDVALEVAQKLKNVDLDADVIYCRFIKPLDSNTIISSVLKTKRLVTIEDNTVEGGFGSRVLETINQKGINAAVKMFGYPDAFIPHGSTKELAHMYRLDPDSIFNDILKLINKSRV